MSSLLSLVASRSTSREMGVGPPALRCLRHGVHPPQKTHVNASVEKIRMHQSVWARRGELSSVALGVSPRNVGRSAGGAADNTF